MKSRTLTALSVLALLGIAHADTIRLKNGTTYQGRVLKEDGEHYVVEVQITKSIKDEKRILKADVAEIVREQPDQKAFAELSTLAPAPDLLDSAAYQARIAKLYGFLKSYPTSPHAAKVKKMTAELENEQTAVEAGGVKINGKIISAEARQADAVEIDARVLAASIRGLADSNALVPALRKATELEKNFAGTVTFREFRPELQKIVATYRAQAAAAAADYAARAKERDSGLTQMQPNDRADTERALAEQSQAVKTRYHADKQAGVKWLVPDPWDKPALDEAARYADQESKRLETAKLDTTADAGKAWRDAWTAIHASPVDQTAVSNALSAARSANLPKSYLSRLEDEAKAAGVKP